MIRLYPAAPTPIAAVEKPRVIIFEDEPDILDLIDFAFQRAGFDTYPRLSGESFREEVQQIKPNLIVLDLMMPRISGQTICRALKSDAQTASIPVIISTSLGDERDVLEGYRIGADDYVVKPFKPRELVARAEAILRRDTPGKKVGTKEEKRNSRHGLEFDVSKHEARLDGEPLSLTISEYRILQALSAHPGRIFNRNQLMQVMNPAECCVDHDAASSRTIDVHVRAIRRKLGEKAFLIQTRRGLGYCFCP